MLSRQPEQLLLKRVTRNTGEDVEKEHVHTTGENINLKTCVECPLKIAKAITT